MTANKYTGIPSPGLERELDRALAEMGREIEALRLPGLAGVVLGGGYGRGEGGVRHTPEGDRLYNDLDFFVFGDRADRRRKQAIAAALVEISEKWEPVLGVDIDFSPVKNLSELRRAAPTLMFQELRNGWKPVWGAVDPARMIPALAPDEVPFSEAVRLLMNRGMGLVFAGDRLNRQDRDADFIVRNMNKTMLGCGDATLLAAGRYCWSGTERCAAFADYVREQRMPEEFGAFYADAFRYKLEPVPVLPEDPFRRWRECRRFYLDTVRRVSGAGPDADADETVRGLRRRAAGARSFRNFLRWMIKARSPKPLSRMSDAPEATVLEMLFRLLSASENCPDLPPELHRLWRLFN